MADLKTARHRKWGNYMTAGWGNYVIVGWGNFLMFLRLMWGNYLTVDKQVIYVSLAVKAFVQHEVQFG